MKPTRRQPRANSRDPQRDTNRRDEARRDEAQRDADRRDGSRRESAHRSDAHRENAHRGDARHDEGRRDEARRNEGRRVESSRTDAQLYGVLPVLEALRAGSRRVERVTVAEGAHESRLHELFEAARAAGVPVRRAPRAELQRIAAGANHQGVVASVAAAAYRDAEELIEQLAARVGTDAPPLAVVLDGVEDPRNLGAIIRTAECAGVDALFVPERRAVGLTETVAKSSAGALEYLPVARAQNIARLVEDFKERGIWTIGTDADANIVYTDWDWTQPCALLCGGEGAGLRRLVRERCDALVRIPLRGRIASLNVSVAAAVVLYEAVRQRTASGVAAYRESRIVDD
jgi:23S rRNA (guanosine2251-2'-O)-methyltransferase